MIITIEEEAAFRKTECVICRNELLGVVKVRDYDCLTGKYRGPAQIVICNYSTSMQIDRKASSSYQSCFII